MTRIQLINAGEFRTLFLESLGWDRPTLSPLTVVVGDNSFQVTEVANFSGIRVWLCNELPDAHAQRQIDAQVQKVSAERLLIFADNERQEWRWLQSPDPNGSGQPRLVTHRHWVGSTNAALDQRLEAITIGLGETPTLIEVLRRMRSAFDADVVTKRFYDQFIKKQQMLTDAIQGISDEGERDWYAALIMNRLMFVYFMQKKGFMDNDRDYLRNRLIRIGDMIGQGHFYDFYRDFLMPVFHTGLGSKGGVYDAEVIQELVGDVPYINGGIFAIHPLEASNDINVPDSAFASIFELFDRFQWHLDDRPHTDGNEINPDVLGYIFEQFVNQKESQDDKGAYYTKEDVTHFMVSTTLVPVFLERVESRTGLGPWALLQSNPERYVWLSLGWGAELPLPADIEAERDLSHRPAWAAVAGDEYGLPSETWWEVVRRREDYASLLAEIRSGGVGDVDLAVTKNIDLETLAVDLIDSVEKSGDALAIWNVISELRVVDPTCGSGAFLFAALRILSPLYEATLDALRRADDSDETAELLGRVADHANESYFVLKHATLSNLFGVDIMREAVEIARLRLFLKLVSTIEQRADLEPLPDLDFNIKAGNALVGALDETDFELVADDLFTSGRVAEVQESAHRISEKFNEYREAQELDSSDLAKTLRKELTELLDEGRTKADSLYHEAARFEGELSDWIATHNPFHWYIEFPGVFANGGFDVVIGNPPYVAKTDIDYTFKGFKTGALPDIYAPCCERAAGITREDGRLSLIIPISSQFGDRYAPLRSVYSDRFSSIWVSAFQERPSRLFQVKVRSSIIVASGARSSTPAQVHTTLTHSWIEQFRPHLLATLHYVVRPKDTRTPNWMRSSSETMFNLLDKLQARGTAESALVRVSDYAVGWKKTATYFLSTFTVSPKTYDLKSHEEVPLNEGQLCTQNRSDQLALGAVLASKLAFLWWTFTGDCFNVTRATMVSFPFSIRDCSKETYDALVKVGQELEDALPNAQVWDQNSGKLVGGYSVPDLRKITDQADELILKSFGMEALLPEVEYAHARMFKSTGESSTTVRKLPF